MVNQYGVIRTEKIKSIRSLCGRLAHNVRAQDVPNAIPEMSHLNIIPSNFNTVEQCLARFKSLLGDHKPRKNAVYAREFVVSGSPEAMKGMSRKKQEDYFKDAARWIAEEMGGRKNVISLAVHFDEGTPHLHIVCACILKGKLNDRALFGGHRDRLIRLQTEFHESVARKYSLDRGLKKSKAKHVPQKEYSAKLKKEIADLESSIEALEAEKRKIDKDVKYYSKYARPMLIERLRSHFRLSLDNNGEVIKLDDDKEPEHTYEKDVKPDFQKVERGFRPKL